MSSDAFHLLRSVLNANSPVGASHVAGLIGHDLLAEITDVLRTDSRLRESVAARSYAHTNGFDRISLCQERGGREVRVHLWWMGVPSDESIHNHAWDFSSLVLTGSLTFELLDRAAGGESYDRYASNMPLGGRAGDYEFSLIGRTAFAVAFQATAAAGSFYRLDHDTYHRVLASPPSQSPLTATMVVKGPVRRSFSHVLVPCGTPMPRTKSMRRLSGEEIVQKLDLLLSELK